MGIFVSRLSGTLTAEWSHQLGTALNAGIPILSILESESMKPIIKRVSKEYWLDILSAVRSGLSLHEALMRHEECFPKLFLAMLKVGEESGHLGEILIELSKYYDNMNKIAHSFRSALVWPTIELVMAICIVGLVILVQGILDVDMLGLGITGISGLIKYLLFLGGLGAIITFLFVWGKQNFDRISFLFYFLDKIPVVGKVLRTFALTRLTRGLQMTLMTGMDPFQAVDLAFDASAYPPIRNKKEQVKSVLASGGTFFESFRSIRAFDDLMLMQVHIGEESGSIPEVMDRLSDLYMDKSMNMMNTVKQIGQALFFLLIAAIIIFFIFRLFSFYYGMLTSIGTG